MFIVLFLSAVVVVGFREIRYRVSESAGSVGLEVAVIRGTLEKDVKLLLSTDNGTATGTVYATIYIMCEEF